MPKKPDRRDDTLTLPKEKVQVPRMYKVLLHNDDYTPMDFVILILESIFRKSHAEAVHIMLSVHRKGLGLAGVYTREVAETKVKKVVDMSQQNEHPLQCTMEPE
jgi:ATP-dependent Clp protease adaptor protein ClpS